MLSMLALRARRCARLVYLCVVLCAAGLWPALAFAQAGPDLMLNGTAPTPLTQGQMGATFTVTPRNIGAAATSGAVIVFLNVFGDDTLTAASGSGWDCNFMDPQFRLCQRFDSLAPNADYPPITVTVNIGASATSANLSSSITGGGDTNPGNNFVFLAAPIITVIAAPTITAAFSPATVAVGSPSTLTLTITNPNTAALTGVAVQPSGLPSGLTGSSPGTTCTSGTATYNSGTRNLSLSGATLNAGASCTVTLSVTPSTPGSHGYVTGAVSATGPNPVTGSSTAIATLNATAPAPTITSVTPTAGPTSGGTSVTITGTNFTGVTAVNFGGTAAAGFTFNSPTSITATSPAGTAGTVDIKVEPQHRKSHRS